MLLLKLHFLEGRLGTRLCSYVFLKFSKYFLISSDPNLKSFVNLWGNSSNSCNSRHHEAPSRLTISVIRFNDQVYPVEPLSRMFFPTWVFICNLISWEFVLSKIVAIKLYYDCRAISNWQPLKKIKHK